MKLEFDTHGNEKQKEAARAWVDPAIADIVYGGSKGGAKSFTGCSLIFGDALIYPGTHYFIARKKLNDLNKFTIPSIHEVFGIWGITPAYYSFNGQHNYFTLYNKSRVYLLEAKFQPGDPLYARFGSMQMTRGWIEEAGEFELEAKNNLHASIGRWKNEEYNLPGKLLQTCNPQKNYLYSDYYKPWKEGKLEPWKKFIQALPQDNKMLDAGYLEHLRRTLTLSERKRLLEGEWEYDDDPQKLFDYNKILELFTNEFVTSSNQIYLSADIAYEGSDLFVIGIWQGLKLVYIEAIDKIDEVLVSKKIQDLRLKWRVPLGNVIYDGDGLKTFVRHSAEQGTLAGAVRFHNGGKARFDEKYYNLKAQCYFKLAELVENNEIYIATKEYRKQIIEELEQIRKLVRKDDNDPHRLEKKKDLKDRLGRSPDFADMIMMRCYYELTAKKKQTNNNWANAFG